MTILRFLSLILAVWLKARETVDWETPSIFATSIEVTFRFNGVTPF
ncbi:hypothetical protein JCM19235_2284 [Vibrio maritimus]|uniref:Uncharacterized protein n=1 Tax=Vibrio maritimus TaxID=990268 RepID=A0A090RU92_9VIBR|nr:hypothetical protein JCM19235_2284 [Vibrio maritimus]